MKKHPFEHAHECGRRISFSPRKYILTWRKRELEHDRGVKQMFDGAVGEASARGATVMKVENERDVRAEFSRLADEIRRERGHLFLHQSDRRQVAEEMGLKVVDGKVRIPDARIRVRERWGEEHWLALEYTTDQYRAHSIQVKAAAGFTVAGPRAGKWILEGPDARLYSKR